MIPSEPLEKPQRIRILGVIGPGLLVAATGVGAGDLAGGAFAGGKLGVAVLWAVLLGAFFKYVLTEGLARWQLATGQTLLEGAVLRLGRPVQIVFALYLLVWSFALGAALMSACGVATTALLPVLPPETGKVVFGMLGSMTALFLVIRGTFASFERIMSLLIGLMFATVLLTAVRIHPQWTDILKGVVLPRVPESIDAAGRNQGPAWTLALMGGVGGTLTILCYGYWIREKRREGMQALALCRIDLGVAYTVTALFGMAMVVIASTSAVDQQPSARLVVTLADRLQSALGNGGRILFLIGAWSAVFSSLLGVWQAVPYLFADFWRMRRSAGKNTVPIDPAPVNTRGAPYRTYLFGLALLPMIGLGVEFVVIQKIYAVIGSLVIPFLAILLLLMNGNGRWVGRENRNRPTTVLILASTVIVFLVIAWPRILP